MEENKKRKARSPPLSQEKSLGRRTRKAKKKAENLPTFSSEEDIEDERGRTPSGSNLTGTVKDLRFFFSPMSKSKMSEEASGKNQSTVKKDQPCVKTSDDQRVKGDNNNNNGSSCLCENACTCPKLSISVNASDDEN